MFNVIQKREAEKTTTKFIRREKISKRLTNACKLRETELELELKRNKLASYSQSTGQQQDWVGNNNQSRTAKLTFIEICRSSYELKRLICSISQPIHRNCSQLGDCLLVDTFFGRKWYASKDAFEWECIKFVVMSMCFMGPRIRNDMTWHDNFNGLMIAFQWQSFIFQWEWLFWIASIVGVFLLSFISFSTRWIQPFFYFISFFFCCLNCVPTKYMWNAIVKQQQQNIETHIFGTAQIK